MNCDICGKAATIKLRRRGTFALCPPCYAYAEWQYQRDIATDPIKSSLARAAARRKVRTLARLMREMRSKEQA